MVKKSKESEIEKLDIDKEEIVKEIKKEAKEELLEEVTRKIDYESKKSLERAEKKIYKYKNFSIMKRNIIILIFLAVIIFETKTLYDNDLLFNKKLKENTSVVDKDTNNDNSNDEIVKDFSWYKENYGYLLENINTNLEDKYYLYKDSYIIDTIKNDVKLNMAYQLLDEEDKIKNNGIINISSDKLKNSYEKIFGSVSSYSAENFKDDCIQFIYNKEADIYMAIDTTCTKTNEELLRYIQNIYEKDDELVMDVLIGILKDKTLTDMNGTKIKNNYSSELFDNVKDKLNKYEFVFEKINDEYYLKEINRK